MVTHHRHYSLTKGNVVSEFLPISVTAKKPGLPVAAQLASTWMLYLHAAKFLYVHGLWNH